MLNKDKIKEETKGKIFNIIGKLDNGSHSSNQLQGVDEAIMDILAHLSAQYEKLIEECIDKIKKNPTEDQEDGLEYDEAYDDALEDIRTSLQERGVKIK